MRNANKNKNSMVKAALVSGLTVAVLSTTIGGAAIASNYGDQQVYRDGNFGQIASQLRQNLRSDGYIMMDIQADGDNRINVYAKKNNKPYELKYSYPGLKLISSKQKTWSNLWQGKNDNYRNNQQANNDDIEDRIQKESRYPAVKQRAIRKVTSMGYRVEDIELDEKNNRGVFEIEAKKGSQDYEILLSYPNLEVIKLEKD